MFTSSTSFIYFSISPSSTLYVPVSYFSKKAGFNAKTDKSIVSDEEEVTLENTPHAEITEESLVVNENIEKSFSVSELQVPLISYADVISTENLTEGLARTKSGTSPGLDGEVKANFTEDKLLKLHYELKSQKFQPRPSKRIQIPKPDGGTRPLSIASQRDKVVQAAILIKLEPRMELLFYDNSYGFRPKRNCHDALREIKRKWQNITWIISIDIAKYFDTINHQIMLKQVATHCDQATTELIGKFLTEGYVDIHNLANAVERSEMGIPQGSLISPILSNLYLHSLDSFVENKLIPEWNKGNERKFVSGYQSRKYLNAHQKNLIAQLGIEGLEKVVQSYKHNQWISQGFHARDPMDPNFRRLKYVRYADDFIIGFCGHKNEAEQIKLDIETFLAEELKLKVNETKSCIHHSGDKNIKFLGFYIRYLPNKLVLDSKLEDDNIKQLKSVALNQAQLRIPVNLLLQRLADKGIATKRKNGTFRATSCRKYGSLENAQIVNRFSSIIRGLLNYYLPANQFSDMWSVVSIIRKSCALTLADKLKLRTASKAYNIFGSFLKVTDRLNPAKTTVLDYPTSLKTTGNFKLGKPWVNLYLIENDPLQGSYGSNPKTSLTCQYPGCTVSDGLEEHHFNEIKNLKKKNLPPYIQSLIRRKRETITLCREHHLKVHGKSVRPKES